MLARISTLIAVFIYLTASMAFSAVPPMINYQGKLMQPNGTPVPDGEYEMAFAIYGQPDGGTALWSEVNEHVQIKGGLYSVLLGSVINLPANIFDSPDRFFGVKVGDDPEMTPRQQVASTAFAFRAASSQTVDDGTVTTAKIAPGAVTADRLATGVAIPPGVVLMWSGAADQIPQGWTLCDGTNNTPDLTARFVVGVGTGVGTADRGGPYGIGDFGGEKSHPLTEVEMPKHSHGVIDPGHSHTAPSLGPTGSYEVPSTTTGYDYTGGAPVSTNTTGISLQNAGGLPDDTTSPHENRPPYYALCFIMKLAY